MKTPGLFLLQLLVVGCCLNGCASSAAPRQRTEKTFRVSGYVLDSVSRKPVAGVFVNVGNAANYFGAPQTDKRGHFVLHIPARARKQFTDVTVHTVLYEGQAAIPADTVAEIAMLLQRNAYRLPTDDCAIGLADTLRMKHYASTAALRDGYELAFLVQDSLLNGTDTLRTLLLDANHLQLDQEGGEYMLHFYQPNGPEHGPGYRWEEETIVLYLNRLATSAPVGTAGQMAVDVRRYHIPVSRQGIFIALKPVISGNLRYRVECLSNYTPSGRLLRPACTVAANSTWLYQPISQVYYNSWCPLPPAENPVPLYYQGIQVELVGHK